MALGSADLPVRLHSHIRGYLECSCKDSFLLISHETIWITVSTTKSLALAASVVRNKKMALGSADLPVRLHSHIRGYLECSCKDSFLLISHETIWITVSTTKSLALAASVVRNKKMALGSADLPVRLHSHIRGYLECSCKDSTSAASVGKRKNMALGSADLPTSAS